MPLSADRNVQFYASQELLDLGVDDNVRIYKGAFVGRNRATGQARGLVAGDEFLGVAYRQADNTSAGHTAGGVAVRLQQSLDIVHTLSGVTISDIGKDVYASADDTLTLLPTGNSRIGRIVDVEGTNLARIRCQPLGLLDGLLDNGPVVQLADANVTLTLDHMNRTLLIANTAARTVMLPPAATVRAGAWLRVIKTSGAAFAVTIDADGAELIDGAATFALIDAAYDSARLVCTGSEWVSVTRKIT